MQYRRKSRTGREGKGRMQVKVMPSGTADTQPLPLGKIQPIWNRMRSTDGRAAAFFDRTPRRRVPIANLQLCDLLGCLAHLGTSS